VSGFGSGVWTVSAGGDSVTQSVNGQPTVFYSDFPALGTRVTGRLRMNSGSDNDFVGFVLGFDPGDSANGQADFLLVDWKDGTQSFNFGTPSASPGGTALSGLAVSRVLGIPDADEFWQHQNLAGTPESSGVTELARGATLGGTGWATNTDYDFTFEFGPDRLRISVNGVEQLGIQGQFSDGRLGFYNFSQANVTYSGFEVSEIPLPAASWLFLTGLSGVLGRASRRRKPSERTGHSKTLFQAQRARRVGHPSRGGMCC
jgi:hypothetical protein